MHRKLHKGRNQQNKDNNNPINEAKKMEDKQQAASGGYKEALAETVAGSGSFVPS
jgi:hypothetical protein